MTVTGHLGVAPDLTRLYEHGYHIPYWWIGEGILRIEHGKTRQAIGLAKGLTKDAILRTTTTSKGGFFNQTTVVFRLSLGDGDGGSACGPWKEVNIKLFNDGGFQMTGIKSEEMARRALTRLIELNVPRGVWSMPPTIQKFKICMMNSNYTIGRDIRRDRLYKVLLETYGLCTTYEPTIYQAVNTKFFWNSERPASAPPGICACPSPCKGMGSGYGVGHCRQITIAPFRTGSIIIVGTQSTEQLMDAYTFINRVFEDHPDVLRPVPPEPSTSTSIQKKIYVPDTTTEVLRIKLRGQKANKASAVVSAENIPVCSTES